jgi:hypothetical protein
VEFGLDGTLGRLFVVGDDRPRWWTIEDAVRPPGVKHKGQTAIQAGTYTCRLSMSPRLKRVTPELLDVPMFAGIRIHALNTPEESLGCIGPGLGRMKGKLAVTQSRKAEAEIIALLRSWGGQTTIEVS